MHTIISKIKNSSIVTKTSLAYVLCVFLQKGIQVLTWPFFTRMLTLEQYGQYTIYVSWVDIITVFLTLNLSVGLFPKAMELFTEKRAAYISACQTISLMLTGVFMTVMLLLRNRIGTVLGLPTVFLIVMVINIETYLPIQLTESRWRFLNQYKKAVLLTSLYSVSSPIVALVLIRCSSEKGLAMIIGMILVPSLIGFVYGIRNYITSKSFINKELFAFAVKSHIPLVAYFLSQTALNQSDRIMISRYCGNEKAAVYGVANSLAMLMTLVANALNNSYIPLLYEDIHQPNRRRIHFYAVRNALILAVLVLCVILMAPEIILVMGGREYYEARWIVPPVACSVLLLFYAQLFINIQLYFEAKKPLVIISCAATLLNIVLNAIALPVFGYYAAGVTTWISYLLYVVLNYIAYKKIIKKNEESSYYTGRQLLVLYFLFLVFTIAGVVVYNYFIIRVMMFVLLLGLSVVFQKKMDT